MRSRRRPLFPTVKLIKQAVLHLLASVSSDRKSAFGETRPRVCFTGFTSFESCRIVNDLMQTVRNHRYIV